MENAYSNSKRTLYLLFCSFCSPLSRWVNHLNIWRWASLVKWPRQTQATYSICVMVDYFTKWSEAFPLPSKTFLYSFGVPKRILTNQGQDFVNEVCWMLQRLNVFEIISYMSHLFANAVIFFCNWSLRVICSNQKTMCLLLPTAKQGGLPKSGDRAQSLCTVSPTDKWKHTEVTALQCNA